MRCLIYFSNRHRKLSLQFKELKGLCLVYSRNSNICWMTEDGKKKRGMEGGRENWASYVDAILQGCLQVFVSSKLFCIGQETWKRKINVSTMKLLHDEKYLWLFALLYNTMRTFLRSCMCVYTHTYVHMHSHEIIYLKFSNTDLSFFL